MAQIDEIKAKIKALRAETEANSITPDSLGLILDDMAWQPKFWPYRSSITIHRHHAENRTGESCPVSGRIPTDWGGCLDV